MIGYTVTGRYASTRVGVVHVNMTFLQRERVRCLQYDSLLPCTGTERLGN